MPNYSKHAFGAKENLPSALEAEKINEFDIAYLTNGEIAWVNGENEIIVNTPRTQTPIEVNGVTGLGIENGSTIDAGKTIDEIVKMLVQKAIPAVYTIPTLSLANYGGQASGNVEAGTSITPKLRATFSQNDAGDLSAISISQGENVVVDGTTSPLDYVGEEIVIGDETISYVASASYGDAPIKNDNLGNESTENWFAGSTVKSSAYSISGKRNMFYGTGVGNIPEITSDAVRGLANKKLNPTQGYSFNISVAVGQQYIVIAYPATLRDLNNVTYVEANDGGMAENFTKTLVDVADARGGENGVMSYKVFTYEMAVPAAATMTFSVTI